jgi:hypothetical protein
MSIGFGNLRLRARAPAGRRATVVLLLLQGRGGLVAGVDPRSNKALLEAVGDDA